jgi:hypothetical protein
VGSDPYIKINQIENQVPVLWKKKPNLIVTRISPINFFGTKTGGSSYNPRTAQHWYVYLNGG